jgi:filamentous hemagglutinin
MTNGLHHHQQSSDSRIIAGGTLTQRGGSLLNTNSEGLRTTRYSGWAQFRDWDGDDEELDFGRAYAFSPAPLVTSFTLDIARFADHAVPTGSGTRVAALSVGGVGASVGGASAAIGSGSAVPRITRVDIPGVAGGAASVVATVSRIGALPASSLYRPNPDASGRYLIETDPRFAGYRQWLTSDYMLTQLSVDPATTQKRLGDGFYEQRLLSEQVAQLTGRRFLAGFANEEEQYRALMNAGVTYARTWQLIPGVALSAEQMAQLTSDMVWLVEQDVTLADGSTQKVLVPQLYARLQPGDLAPSGALLAGNVVDLDVSGDLTNLGTIAGRHHTKSPYPTRRMQRD